jgi:hypothetical protein
MDLQPNISQEFLADLDMSSGEPDTVKLIKRRSKRDRNVPRHKPECSFFDRKHVKFRILAVTREMADAVAGLSR